MTPLAFSHSIPPRAPASQQEYSRLLTAAVVNQSFRRLLLTNPKQALASGYAGEAFHLGSEEQARVSAIRASSLEDFARQLQQIQDVPFSAFGCYAGD